MSTSQNPNTFDYLLAVCVFIIAIVFMVAIGAWLAIIKALVGIALGLVLAIYASRAKNGKE